LSGLQINQNCGKMKDMRAWKRYIAIGMAAQLVMLGDVAATAGDPGSASSSYSMTESQFGGGGNFSSQSAGYSFVPTVDDGGATLGEAAVGGSSSVNYSSGAGFNTTAQPGLSMIVGTSAIDFGNVSVGVMANATAVFSVKNYTSYGYVVTVIGAPPIYSGNGHALTALATDTAYNASAEQFGINLVLNTVAGVGANPVQVPTSSFSYGVAGDGTTGTYGTTRPYTTSDKWRFASGETVASAPKTSGETDYTVTFMMNAIQTTPGGKYSGGFDLVATGSY
jgi:hypothetical protein